jgi:hypothetical protein
MTEMETSARQIVVDLSKFEQETEMDQINAAREDKNLDARLVEYQGIYFPSFVKKE